MKLLAFLLTFLMALPVLANDSLVDIVPPKGVTGKFVHILFDQSGSMGVEKHEIALRQLAMSVMWSVEEFNVKVTAFGESFTTLIPSEANGFKVSKEHPTWMSFPSEQNIDKILEWLGETRVGRDATNFTGAVSHALGEGIEDLSITVVSDCIMDDVGEFSTLVGGLQIPVRIIFAVIPSGAYHHYKIEDLYDFCKDNSLYWINVRENGR